MAIDDLPDSSPALPATAEEAYLQAKAGNALFGQELQAWSPSRIIAANAMGLVWPLPETAMDQLANHGVYSGALRDTIILCWLRTLRNASEQDKDSVLRGDWTVQKALRAPHDAFEAATAWAHAHGMVAFSDDPESPFGKAYKLALATLLGVSLSEFEVVTPPGAQTTETATPNG